MRTGTGKFEKRQSRAAFFRLFSGNKKAPPVKAKPDLSPRLTGWADEVMLIQFSRPTVTLTTVV